MIITGKTITQLPTLPSITSDTLFVVDYSGTTYNIPYSSVVSTGSTSNYKIYTALLTQTGTNAPTAIVLENTLGTTPTFTYYPGSGFDPLIGVYSIDASDTFIPNKTTVYCANANNGLILLDPNLGAPNNIYIYSYDITGPSLADNILNNTFIEIRVYN